LDGNKDQVKSAVQICPVRQKHNISIEYIS